MFKRWLVLVVVLSCFCGVGVAEEVSGDVSGDVSVKPVGVDEFFKDGVNGIRFGASVAECGDRVKFSGPNPLEDDSFIYYRVDGLNLLGDFLNGSEHSKCETGFIFEGKNVETATLAVYDEVAYGADSTEILKWTKGVWGEPTRNREYAGQLLYTWLDEKMTLILLVNVDEEPYTSVQNAVVAISVGY